MNSTVEQKELLIDTWRELDVTIDNLWKYGGTTLISLGTIGHLLSIIVVNSSRSLRRQSSGVLVTALSVTGILTLYLGVLRSTILGYSQWNIDIRNFSTAVCKGHQMLTYMSLQCIAWLQATVAIDRVIHVALPAWNFRYHIKRKLRWKHGLIIVTVEAAVAACLNICPLFIVGIKEEGYCGKLDKYKCLENIWRYVDLLSFSLVPSAIIIICNCTILATVSYHKVRSEEPNTKLMKRRRSLTAMLSTVNVWFLITTLPISLVVLGSQWDTSDKLKLIHLHAVYAACSFLQYIGTSSTFFIYCVSGSRFRSQLRRLLSRTEASIRRRSSTFSRQSTKQTSV